MLKKPEAEAKKNVTGLCSNCIHESNCALEKQGLVHCGEHAVSPFALTDEDVRDIMYMEPEKKQEKQSSGKPVAGICMNCDKKRDCPYIQPGNVIWHCEEYV